MMCGKEGVGFEPTGVLTVTTRLATGHNKPALPSLQIIIYLLYIIFLQMSTIKLFFLEKNFFIYYRFVLFIFIYIIFKNK